MGNITVLYSSDHNHDGEIISTIHEPNLSMTTEITTPDTVEDTTLDQDETGEERVKVIAHDDPITTMEFVVHIMVQIFKKPIIFAEAIMWQVHNEGHSVVDVLPRPEAEFRVKKATAAARLEGFPFRFTIEAE